MDHLHQRPRIHAPNEHLHRGGILPRYPIVELGSLDSFDLCQCLCVLWVPHVAAGLYSVDWRVGRGDVYSIETDRVVFRWDASVW